MRGKGHSDDEEGTEGDHVLSDVGSSMRETVSKQSSDAPDRQLGDTSGERLDGADVNRLTLRLQEQDDGQKVARESESALDLRTETGSIISAGGPGDKGTDSGNVADVPSDQNETPASASSHVLRVVIPRGHRPGLKFDGKPSRHDVLEQADGGSSPPQQDGSKGEHVESKLDARGLGAFARANGGPTTQTSRPSARNDPNPRLPRDRRLAGPKPVPIPGNLLRGPWGNSDQTSHITSTSPEQARYSWQSAQDEEPNRPRIHIVKLISNTTSASAGFPGGEALQFSISPAGRRIAAYNSARLYILQTVALPVGVSQDFALKRRPLAVEIVDDGNTLAILADQHTINIYELGYRALQRTRTLKLDFPTNCIALSRTGGLIAAAYEGGIEIFSLAPNALPSDRRAVRSQRMDRLTFSEDSSTLLGTTTRINASSTVVVSVPIYPADPDGVPTQDELKEAWCSDLLHPENIRNSSHAIFAREDRAASNDHLFAWNGFADTFGILNVANLQYGNIDFPVVISPPLSTWGGLGAAIHSCPSIDEGGDTVAMIVNDRTVRLYIVPASGDNESAVEAHSIDHELDEGYGNPFSDIRWVHSSSALPAPLGHPGQTHGRLIVASPGGVSDSNTGLDMHDIEGGRIVIFDFDPQFIGELGQTFSLTLGKATPQLLEEEAFDAAEEVAVLRRRTVNQRKGGDLIHRPVQLGRAATTFVARDRAGQASSGRHAGRSEPIHTLADLAEDGDSMDAFEQPYQQNAPRSQASLQRSATNVQRHKFQTLEERRRERFSIDSSIDGIPVPEYTAEPNAPLPSRYRALAGLDQPAPPAMNEKPEASSPSAPAAVSSPIETRNTAPSVLDAVFRPQAIDGTRNPDASGLAPTTLEAIDDSLYKSSYARTPDQDSSDLNREPTLTRIADPEVRVPPGTGVDIPAPAPMSRYMDIFSGRSYSTEAGQAVPGSRRPAHISHTRVSSSAMTDVSRVSPHDWSPVADSFANGDAPSSQVAASRAVSQSPRHSPQLSVESVNAHPSAAWLKSSAESSDNWRPAPLQTDSALMRRRSSSGVTGKAASSRLFRAKSKSMRRQRLRRLSTRSLRDYGRSRGSRAASLDGETKRESRCVIM